MSFTYGGNTWIPQSTLAHTNNIMGTTNRLLQEHSITDENGHVIQLRASFANALYLLSMSSAQAIASYDEKLTKAINSFNLELCDDQQIHNLLPVAAVTRGKGTKSTIVLSCTASDVAACTIQAGSRLPFGDTFFVVSVATTIAKGMTESVVAVCEKVGPIVVLTGEITAFENPVPNLKSVINKESSVPGKAPETINELRKRLIGGNTIKYSLDGCTIAIANLPGINYARIYFNYNTQEVITLAGGVQVKPRYAYIVVYGESDKIADTYAEHMSAPTQNAQDAPEKKQEYITQSNQHIPVYFDNATEQDIYVKVILDVRSETGTHVTNQIKKDLVRSSAYWNIGQPITQALTSAPFIDSSYTSVAYTQVSTDGNSWKNIITPGANVLPRLSDAHITVEQVQ